MVNEIFFPSKTLRVLPIDFDTFRSGEEKHTTEQLFQNIEENNSCKKTKKKKSIKILP